MTDRDDVKRGDLDLDFRLDLLDLVRRGLVRAIRWHGEVRYLDAFDPVPLGAVPVCLDEVLRDLRIDGVCPRVE